MICSCLRLLSGACFYCGAHAVSICIQGNIQATKNSKKTQQAARHQAGFCRCSHGRSKPILGGVPCGNRFINCTKAVIRRAYDHTRPAGSSDAATAAFRGHLVRHALRWGWRVGSILRDAMCVRIDGCNAASDLCSKSNHEV